MNRTALAPKGGSKYSDQDRYAAMACYAVHGNHAKCSEVLNIPARTMQQWGESEWWLTALTEVRAQKQDEIDSGIQKIIDRAIGSITERLDKGDEVLDSKGNIHYRAVSARDSATIFGIAFDKQRVLRLLPTTITATTGSDKLLKLLNNFEEIAHKKTREIEASVVAEG